MFLRLFLLPIIWCAFISICSLAEISKCINWEILAKWLTMTLHDLLFCKSYMKLLLWTVGKDCVKYSIVAYDKCILRRYILPFCFGKVNSRNYHGDSLNVTFFRFPNCFLPFSLVFFFSIIKALDSLYHAYKQIITLYPNQGFLDSVALSEQQSMLFRNYCIDSKHIKPK